MFRVVYPRHLLKLINLYPILLDLCPTPLDLFVLSQGVLVVALLYLMKNRIVPSVEEFLLYGKYDLLDRIIFFNLLIILEYQ